MEPHWVYQINGHSLCEESDRNVHIKQGFSKSNHSLWAVRFSKICRFLIRYLRTISGVFISPKSSFKCQLSMSHIWLNSKVSSRHLLLLLVKEKKNTPNLKVTCKSEVNLDRLTAWKWLHANLQMPNKTRI